MQKLAEDRYFKNDLFMVIDGRKMPCVRYGYESHGKLYDVDVIASVLKTYAVNCRYIADSEATNVHRQIEERFSL